MTDMKDIIAGIAVAIFGGAFGFFLSDHRSLDAIFALKPGYWYEAIMVFTIVAAPGFLAGIIFMRAHRMGALAAKTGVLAIVSACTFAIGLGGETTFTAVIIFVMCIFMAGLFGGGLADLNREEPPNDRGG